MAYTKIHPIKATIHKAIEYICNPEKTDDSLLISSFACAAETAAYDFKYALDHANDFNSVEKEEKENKAFHLIQAFQPGEVSFDEAHKIGQQFADQLLEGKYSYVLTTHIDKGHVHNHLIFCAVDNIEHKHYHDCKKTYWNIRKLSDRLCAEHNLSVIQPGERRGKTYKEWMENQNQNSWKTKLKKDINQAIKAVSTYEEFIALMKAKGYEIKNESFDGSDGKYIAFRPVGEKNFVRGRAKSLGANFTKERIQERIEKKKNRAAHFPENDRKLRRIISLENNLAHSNSPGLKHWAAKENLRIATKTYSLMNQKGIHTFSELSGKIAFFQEEAKSANQSIVTLEHKMKDTAEIIKYLEQYLENKPYNDRYNKVKDQDRFLRKYESKIILFGGAKRMLERKGISPSKSTLDKFRQDYQNLLSQKDSLSGQLKNAKSELKELELIQSNMKSYLEVEHEHDSLSALTSPEKSPPQK